MDGQDSVDGSRGHADTHPHPPLKYVDDTLSYQVTQNAPFLSWFSCGPSSWQSPLRSINWGKRVEFGYLQFYYYYSLFSWAFNHLLFPFSSFKLPLVVHYYYFAILSFIFLMIKIRKWKIKHICIHLNFINYISYNARVIIQIWSLLSYSILDSDIYIMRFF